MQVKETFLYYSPAMIHSAWRIESWSSAMLAHLPNAFLPSPRWKHSAVVVLCRRAPCYTHCAMLQETLEQGRALTDAALDRLIPLETEYPESIHKAMRHSVFAGGKRLRPVLCIEAGRMVAGAFPKKIEELGAALEMLHTYS